MESAEQPQGAASAPPLPRASRNVAAAQRRGRPSLARSAEITSNVLRVAGSLFLEIGYEATSMEAVARRAGVPKTTLYKRYGDKNALLRAVVTEQMQNWANAPGRDDVQLPAALPDRLAHHLTTMLVWATKPEVRAINRLATNLPETHGHELSGRSLWGYENMRQMLADAIRQLGPDAGVDPRDPDRVADSLLALVRGWLVGRGSSEPVGPAEAQEAANWFVSLVIKGAAVW